MLHMWLWNCKWKRKPPARWRGSQFASFSGMCFLSYQHCLGLFPAAIGPLVGGFGGVSCERLLDAAFILRATPDIAVVGVFGDDLILPVHRCEKRNAALVPRILKWGEVFRPLSQNLWSFCLELRTQSDELYLSVFTLSLLSEFDACST